MKFRRIRLVLTLVAAMFLANSVAVAARACADGLRGQDSSHVAQQVNGADLRHVASAGGDETPCLAQCAQGYRNPEQKLAPHVAELAFLPIPFVPYFSVEIEPPGSPVALAPRQPAPPLAILFRNFRN